MITVRQYQHQVLDSNLLYEDRVSSLARAQRAFFYFHFLVRIALHFHLLVPLNYYTLDFFFFFLSYYLGYTRYSSSILYLVFHVGFAFFFLFLSGFV